MLQRLFSPDHARYSGVRPINIHLLRVLYALMFFVLGNTVWRHIFTAQTPWEPYEAVAWSVWAGFSVMAGIGLFRPLAMVPVLLLEIFYKVLWLVLVAGAPKSAVTTEITSSFVLVVLPIVAVPWGYVWRNIVRR